MKNQKYILDSKIRANKIMEITENGIPTQAGVKLPIKFEKPLNVYKIPLNLTVYNHLNDRFASKRREYFKNTGKELNIDTEESLELIGSFIWDSNDVRNLATLNDILKNKQQRFGIITSDGRIIDGNRRARILREIYYSNVSQYPHNNKDDFAYFEAVVLPYEIDDVEIQRLETLIQMGEDEKVDYDAIEKYLKVDKLFNLGYKYDYISTIIKSLKDSEKEALNTHNVYKLMCLYLDYIDASDNFSLISKSEDLFLKLQAVLKSYPDNYITDWNPDEEDINQLKIVAFNHIRANYEGKDFRNLIGGPRDMSGIFAHKEIWQKFLKKHTPLIENVEKELNALEKKGNLKDLKQREEFFIKKTKPTLENNMTLGKEALNNKKRSGEITDLITEALDKLNAVNMNKFVTDFKQEAYKALENLIYKAEQMKEIIIKDVYKKAKQ